MLFRPTQQEDIPAVMGIVRQAQAYLKSQGIDQWQNGYPNGEVIAQDIAAGESYVLLKDGQVVGTTVISFRPEKNYEVIYEGNWLSDAPCAVIHRICVDDALKGQGLSGRMIAEAEAQCQERGVASIKVDTHRKNLSMQRLLEKHGFARCGIIYSDDGERIAFEKIL